jgi:hypothetical protein
VISSAYIGSFSDRFNPHTFYFNRENSSPGQSV